MISKIKYWLTHRLFIVPTLIVASATLILFNVTSIGFVDKCDGYNYLTNGFALKKMGRDFMNPNFNTYEDFQKNPSEFNFNLVPYPNKLFSLIAINSSLDENTVYPGRTTMWSTLAGVLGILFLWTLISDISNAQLATITCGFVLFNSQLIFYLGRPLSDPFAFLFITVSLYFFTRSKNIFHYTFGTVFLGLAMAFRLQAFFVLAPIIMLEISRQKTKLQSAKETLISLLLVIIGSFLTFKIIVWIIEISLYANAIKTSNNFGHYINWAKNSLVTVDWKTITNYCLSNFKTVFFNPAFCLPVLGSLYIPQKFRKNINYQFLRWFSYFGLFFPFLFYSISPGFETRYLIYSMPFLVFFTVVNIFNIIPEKNKERISWLATIFIILYWSYISFYTPDILTSFQLKQYFSLRIPLEHRTTPASEGIILTNKSLAGAVFKNFNLIRIPPYEDLLKGDNSLVNALVILYDQGCKSEERFDPNEYLKHNEIIDNKGNKFRRYFEYEQSSPELIVFFREQKNTTDSSTEPHDK